MTEFIYQIFDVTDEESYNLVGSFLDKETAINEFSQLTAEDSDNYDNDYESIVFKIYSCAVGLSDYGKVIAIVEFIYDGGVWGKHEKVT